MPGTSTGRVRREAGPASGAPSRRRRAPGGWPIGRPGRRPLPVVDVRRLLRRIHLLLGVLAAAPLVVASLTGSVLVYRPELDAILHPHLLRVEPGPGRVTLEEALAAVRRAYPGERPAVLQMPRSPRETLEVTLAGEPPLQVYVDPYRGTVLGARREDETFPNVLFHLHASLLAGAAGEAVMGGAALALLALVATGLPLWWPGLRGGLRRLREAVAVRRCANSRRVVFDLHRAGGFWTAAFLVLTGMTGASLVFHDQFMAGLNRITGSPPRPAAPAVAVPRTDGPPLDDLVARGAAAVAGGEVTYVILPGEGGGPVTVRQKVPAELHPNGRNFVYMDPATGEVLGVEDALRAPAGTRAYNVLYPLHIGRWGGPWSRAAYALLGLAPLLLLGTGLLVWWGRAPFRTRPGRPRPLTPAAARAGREGSRR